MGEAVSTPITDTEPTSRKAEPSPAEAVEAAAGAYGTAAAADARSWPATATTGMRPSPVACATSSVSLPGLEPSCTTDGKRRALVLQAFSTSLETFFEFLSTKPAADIVDKSQKRLPVNR